MRAARPRLPQSFNEVKEIMIGSDKFQGAARRRGRARLLSFSLFCWLCAVAAGSPAYASPSGWMRDIAAISDKEVWAVCENGRLLHTTDGGSTWTWRQTPADAPLRAIAFIDARRGFVTGGRGLLLATGDGGETWRRVPTGLDHELTDVFFVGEHGWISGYWGTILRTTDGGQTWIEQQTPVSQPLEKLYFVNQKTGWAVGWMQTILRTNDGGLTWERQTWLESALTLNAVYFRDERNGWAAGMQGLILRTTDGGRNWERQPAPTASWLYDITFTAGGRGVIAGAGETLLTSDDGGASWQKAPAQLAGSIRALVASGAQLWGAGYEMILSSSDQGRAWAPRFVGEKAEEIAVSGEAGGGTRQ